MAVDDNKYDTGDLQDLELEDLDDTSLRHHQYHTTIHHQQGYYDDIYDGPLCVPQDSLDGLDWYPNFPDDFISLGESESFLNEYSGDSSRSNDAASTLFGYNQRVLLKEHSSNMTTNPSNGGLEDYFSAKGDTTLIEAPVTPIQEDEDDKRFPLRECSYDYSSNSSNSTNRVFGHKKKPRQNKRRRRLSWLENQVPGNFLDGDNNKRKCSHCLTERTPQWRMGPLGPKTLCNACGVRHKSGRLLPEYRPAASPTFDVGKHSNFHRKILKRKGINAY